MSLTNLAAPLPHGNQGGGNASGTLVIAVVIVAAILVIGYWAFARSRK